ncbi:hypothetical protein [Streptomyces sp. CAI-85]|uniref:hypothetical protein n=1 Tax=Streptomyces sp. CAI-85 TaxID=1472662 RepID=UPI001587EDAF|nr:hypothetical protein [Streptomyces sp. CAI-85]NUV64995.1 hypothetical protein [Streptomyces sp. CAI-85]
MSLDLAAARAYAARHPENRRHTELLAAFDPQWAAARRRPLDLAAARSRRAAAVRPDEEHDQEQRPAPPVRPAPRRPASLAPVRAAQHPVRATRPLPLPPVTAAQFYGRDHTWRWVSVETGAPAARIWERLAVGLVAAGPFRALRIRGGRAYGPGSGHTEFHEAPDGAQWADVLLDDRHDPNPGRLIAHELGHFADEAVRLESAVSASAWAAEFTERHRADAGEAFAVAAEDWVRPTTTAAELLAAARRHQEQQRRRGRRG